MILGMQAILRIRAHVVALVACGVLPSLTGAQAPVVAISGATVIDGTGARPLPSATVVIQGHRIACMGECQIPAAAEVIDASSCGHLKALV